MWLWPVKGKEKKKTMSRARPLSSCPRTTNTVCHTEQTQTRSHPWCWAQSTCTAKRKHCRNNDDERANRQRWSMQVWFTEEERLAHIASVAHEGGADCIACLWPRHQSLAGRCRPSYKMHAAVGYCVAIHGTSEQHSTARKRSSRLE